MPGPNYNSPNPNQQGNAGSQNGPASETNAAADANSNKYAYPLTKTGPIIATPADHAQRAFGNWMSDNAVDIDVPPNTGVRAVDDSVVSRLSGSAPNPESNPAGWTVYLTSNNNNNEYAYMHLNSYTVEVGQELAKGEVFGKSGTANSVDHLHFASENGNPMDIVGGAEEGGGGAGAGGGGGGELSDSTVKAAAFATYFNIDGMFDTATSMLLEGEKSLMNDKPLFPLIQQLCGASLRRFQSMPDGKFFAFYPDYFGGAEHRAPYWKVYDAEIVDGQIQLNDDVLSTHVYIVGDNSGTHFDGVNFVDMAETSGVINIFNAFQVDFINGFADDDRPGSIVDDEGNISSDKRQNKIFKDKSGAIAFLQKYGARPYYEEASYVRSPFYEAFLAYQKFCLRWSQQFATTFTLTYMPEIFPGGIIELADHNLQVFVESVSHAFNFSTGFTTQISVSSPCSIDRKGNEWEGMVRSGILGVKE